MRGPTRGARIAQINISAGGVPKRAVEQGQVGPLGLAGDIQRNTEYHGGPDRALCLFSVERIDALRSEGHAIEPGSIGENVTVEGLEWDAVSPGVRLLLGDDVLIEITGYATPCRNITTVFSDGDSRRVSQKRHPGWSRVYARVLQGGAIHRGDAVAVAGGAVPRDVSVG
jgi:MOSC domain-containing protein YiiM